MNLAEAIMPIVYGAVLVEAVVTILENVKERNGSWKYWAGLTLGLGLGVLVSVNYNLDLFELAGLEGQIPVVGPILTGVILSRGANFVSDIVGRVRA